MISRQFGPHRPSIWYSLAVWLVTAALLLPNASMAEATDQFQQSTALLLESSFDAKTEGARLIADSGHERAVVILRTMLAGDLYYRKKEQDLVFAERDGREYRITSALDDSPLGITKKRKLKKVKVNNTLRRELRSLIAGLNLSHPDAAKRLAAVEQMLDSANAETAEQLAPFREREEDPAVRERMGLVIALGALTANSPEQRLAAIDAVDDSLHPSVYNGLTRLVQNETDEQVLTRANQALMQIDFERDLYAKAETLFFGLSLGSVLVLAAIGLAITFGVMGVINMAHGELIMLGAYTTYLIQSALPAYTDISLLLAIPSAFLISGLMGVLIERGVIRFLYGRPLETLLATFGVSLILQQLVRTLISPQNVPVENPSWMSGSLEINSLLSLTYNRLYIILFCLAVFAALFMILRRTALGLQVRAVSQNRAMARSMGVRSEWVDAMTFGLGSGIAGIAGVALSQLTNVGPNLGQSYIIDSFMVVVFGGVGNLWGTLVAGMSLGVANKVIEPWAGAVLAKILVLVFIILFIQKRPRGLFPQKGRAAE